NVGSSIGAILTLSGDNSAMTGTIQVSSASSTSLNAGRLNINSPTALGNGTLRLGSAAGYANFDNTSGAPLTLTTSHSIELGASARFLGTFDLDLGPVIADRTTSGVFTL